MTQLPKRIINVDNQVLLLHKRELSNYLRKEKDCLISIEVDLTLSCNHSCPNCTFGNYHSSLFLDEHVIDKILTGLSEVGAKGMIITGGGEPCIHKGLGNFVKQVSESGIDVTLTTNGQFIHHHFDNLAYSLKRIRFSIDAATPHTFKRTHGMSAKDFEQIISNLKNMVQYKKRERLPLDIGVSFMICDENVDEMLSAINFYKKIGVNFLHFKPMQLWDKNKKVYYCKNYPQVKKVFLMLENYREADFRISISREDYYKGHESDITYSQCHGAHFNMIIGADAKVYTCCHFKYNPLYCYGDLLKERFKEVLTKVKSNVTGDCFVHCKMDAINKLVEFAKTEQDKILKISKDLKSEDLPLGSKWL